MASKRRRSGYIDDEVAMAAAMAMIHNINICWPRSANDCSTPSMLKTLAIQVVTLQARVSMIRNRKRKKNVPCTRGGYNETAWGRILANADALLESKSKEAK